MLKIGASSVGAGEKEGRQNVQEGRRFGRDLVPPPLSLEEYPPNAKKVLKKGEKEKKKAKVWVREKKVSQRGQREKTRGIEKNGENREK